MKYCPNCGEPLEDAALFCPVCGEKYPLGPADGGNSAGPADGGSAGPADGMNSAGPANGGKPAGPADGGSAGPADGSPADGMKPADGKSSAAEAAPKKRKSKAGLIIAIAALLILGACAALYFTGAYAKLLPPSRIKLALAEKAQVERALDSVFDAQDKVRASRDVKAHIDLTSSDGLAGLFSETTVISSLLERMNAGIDLDCGADSTNMRLGVEFKGNPLLDATVTRTDETLGLYVPQLDDKYYTIGIQALMGKLAEEADGFDPASFEKLDTEPLDEQKTRREVMELLAALAKASTRENTEVERKASDKLFGGTWDGVFDRYTVTPSAEDLEKAFNAMADILDRDGCYLAEKLAPVYEAVISLSESADDDTDGPETPATLPEFLRVNAERFANELADAHFKLQVLADGSELVSHRFITDEARVSIDTLKSMATGGKTFDRTYIENVTVYGGEKFVDSVQLDVSKTDTSLDGTIIERMNGEDFAVCGIALDLTKESALGTHAGRINLRMADGGMSIVIDSEAEGDAMVHKITYTPGEDDDAGDIAKAEITARVTEGSGVEAPTVSPTDVSDKTLDEIGEIFDGMLQNLTGTLGRMFLFN